jgi:hypothetical protein
VMEAEGAAESEELVRGVVHSVVGGVHM